MSDRRRFNDLKEAKRGGAGARGRGRPPNNLSYFPPEDSPAKPPPGLKGKSIGMWYANRQKQRGKVSQSQPRVLYSFEELKIPSALQQNIESLLKKLNPDMTLELPELQENDSDVSFPSSSSFHKKYMKNLEANAQANSEEALEPSDETFELHRNPDLDALLKEELHQKSQRNPKYIQMQRVREKLPAFAKMHEINELVLKNRVVVISGETGCGKTTQIPQFILDRLIKDENGSICNILCTQPRRISAISVAERVAEERDEFVGGNTVGYSIRLDSRLPKRSGSISFLVVGVLLQRLIRDPYLKSVSHIIVDEIHERDVLSDFLLVILKDLIVKRPDLKVILMSATLNALKFSEYFENCPMFEIPGFTYPVTDYYLEDVIKQTKFQFPTTTRTKQHIPIEFNQLIIPNLRYLSHKNPNVYKTTILQELRKPESEELNINLIQALVEYICATDTSNGAILIFMPGWDTISKVIEQFEGSGKFPRCKYRIYPLHSMVPTINQKEVFNSPPPGIRKIIVSTSIAETSVTIDDVTFVIDTGKIKIANFNKELNVETLDTEWVSRANAKQRRGRAGRVKAGTCFHLFSHARERLLEDFKPPEILRKRLEETVLQIKILKCGKADSFLKRLMDPPEPRVLELAIERLVKIGALTTDEDLTPLGFHLSHLPMDPYTGRMILMASIFGCVDPIYSVASSLSFKDCFYMPIGKEKIVDRIRKSFSGDAKSDHIVLIRAIEGYEDAQKFGNEREYCYKNFLSENTLKMLAKIKREFGDYLYSMKFLPTPNIKDPSINVNSKNTALLSSIICAGLYPNLANCKTRTCKKPNRRSLHPIVRTQEHGRVNFHPKSVVFNETEFESPFFVYHRKMKSPGGINLMDVSMITAFPLVFFGGHLDFIFDRKFGSLGVDGNIRFKCSGKVYHEIEALRKELDKLLDYKIQNPEPTHWNVESNETELLRTIVCLLAAEYKSVMDPEEGQSEDEDEDDE